MLTLRCISIDWCYNCLVLLQPYRTVLPLLEIIATVLLSCNISWDHCNQVAAYCNSISKVMQMYVVIATVLFSCNISHGHCNRYLFIVIKYLKRCNSMLLLSQVCLVAVEQFLAICFCIATLPYCIATCRGLWVCKGIVRQSPTMVRDCVTREQEMTMPMIIRTLW